MVKIYARKVIFSEDDIKHRRVRKIEKEAAERLVFDVLTRFYDVQAASITLLRTEKGKPYIEGIDKHISIAHSNGNIVVAVSDYEVGVDIEKDQPINEKIANRFLCGDTSSSAWTKYESAAKLLGCGIPFDFSDKSKFRFKDYFDIKGFVVTACSVDDEFCDKIIFVE